MFLFLSRWMPLVWMLAAVALGAVEAATVDLVAIWFALGAVVAIIPALFSAPFWVQLVVFLVVSILSLALTRPMAVEVLHVKRTRTNADSVIGMMGVVIRRIDNIEGAGRVTVNGLDWSARSDDGAPIEEHENVLIKSIEGVKVIVERVL